MKKVILKNNKAFVILLAITLMAIILSISLGVADIAYRELKFSTSAKDTNDAFFAADTAIECALYYDRPNSCSGGTSSCFRLPAAALPVGCATATPTSSGTATNVTYSFTVTGLGANTLGCAKVTVTKDGDRSPPYIITTVISKGYNITGSSCGSTTNPSLVEREIKVSY